MPGAKASRWVCFHVLTINSLCVYFSGVGKQKPLGGRPKQVGKYETGQKAQQNFLAGMGAIFRQTLPRGTAAKRANRVSGK